MHWYLDVLKKYAVFNGRASRSEFWFFILFNFIITVLLLVIEATLFNTNVLMLVYMLATLIPSIAVSIRRLHDTGRVGWWILAPIVPIVFYCFPSDSGQNEYGAEPVAK